MNVSSSSLRRGRQSSTAAPTTHGVVVVGGGSSSIGNVVRPSSRRRIVRSRVPCNDNVKNAKQKKKKNEEEEAPPTTTTSAPSRRGGGGGIFDGVVACLSGQACDVKDRIHNIIINANANADANADVDDRAGIGNDNDYENGTKGGGGGGGITMGNFDPRYVTHLVLDAPVGSKYEHWRRNYRLHLLHNARGVTDAGCGDGGNDATGATASRPSPYEWASRLHVVRTAWVEACIREGRRVPEEDYGLPSLSADEADDDEDGDRDDDERVSDDIQYSTMSSSSGGGAALSTTASTRVGDVVVDGKEASKEKDDVVATSSSSMACGEPAVVERTEKATCPLASSSSQPVSGGRRRNGPERWRGERHFSLPEEIVRRAPSLVERCDYVMQERRHRRFVNTASTSNGENNAELFAGQSFLLVGFDDECDDDGHGIRCGNETDNNSSSNNNNINDIVGNGSLWDRRRALKGKVSQLIRKSGGTIYYEPNEWITMVVLLLDDDCNEEDDNYDGSYLRRKMMWDDVRYFCREHPNGPVCVNVDYLLASFYYFYCSLYCDGGDVPRPPFPPEPRPPQPRKLRIAPKLQQKTKVQTRGGGGGGGTTNNDANGAISTAKITGGRKIKSNHSRTKEQNQQQKPTASSSSSSLIFCGDVFVIMPSLAVDNDGAQLVDFVYEEMESIIIDHGGLLLSRSLLQEAVTKVAAKKKMKKMENPIKNAVTPSSENPHYNPHGRSRTYYAISNILTDYSKNNLLEEVSNLGIDVIPVTSVWIAACVRNGCKYDPEEYPLLFQPQTWPIRRLHSWSSRPTDPIMSLLGKGERKERGASKSNWNFLMSVTGFADSSRYGIISMLNEIGAGFTENLSRKNTHLICKEGSGQKYAKAREWGLYVVSVEWLYHVARHGYEEGSEGGFSFVAGTRKEPFEEIAQKQQRLKRCSLDETSSANNPYPVNKDEEKAIASSLNDNGEGGEEKGEDRAGQSATNEYIIMDGGRGTEEEKNRATAKNHFSSRQQLSPSSSLRCHAQVYASSPPLSMPKDDDDCPGQSSSCDEGYDPCSTSSKKRLHFALRTLEEPIAKRRMYSNNIMRTNIIGCLPRHRQRGKGHFSITSTSQAQGTSPSSSSLILPPPFPRQSEIREEDEMSAMSPPEIETQFTIGTIFANGDISLNNKKAYCDYSSEEVPPSQAKDAEDNGESQVVWFAAARG